MSDELEKLDLFLDKSKKTREPQGEAAEMSRFIIKVVMPAFDEIAPSLEKHKREVNIRNTGPSAALIVCRNGEEEMTYRIQGRTFPNGILPYAEIRCRERKGLRYIRVESMFRSGMPNYTLADITKEEIIRNFVENYTARVRPD
jgi:choline/glycine/proline betaine transport protein